MKDRVPTYPGRVKLIPVAGQADTYDMVRADEPIEEGTPLNKASLLNDSVQKAIWGSISDSRTVNSALGRLNSYLPKIQLNYVYTIDDTPRLVTTQGTFGQENKAAPDLSISRQALAAASIGSYALFAGGQSGNTFLSNIDAYNTSLTRTSPTSLSAVRAYLAGMSIGGYALFAGGGGKNGSSPSSVVDAYNTSLTRSTPTALSVARNNLAAAKTPSYAFFAGGRKYTSVTNKDVYATVDAYNSSLTRVAVLDLSVARHSLAGASVGGYAVFAGGVTNAQASTQSSSWGESPVVDAYNDSLTRSTPTSLSLARGFLVGAKVGNYALFGGGATYKGPEGDDTYGTVIAQTIVDAYSSSLVRSTPAALSNKKYELAATTVGNYAIFAGGHSSSGSHGQSLGTDIYDINLTHTSLSSGADAETLAAGTVGLYALFAGGMSSSARKTVNGFVSQYEAHFTIPAWSKYKFDGFHTEEQFTMVDLPWSSVGDVTGYIRPTGYTLEDKLPTNN